MSTQPQEQRVIEAATAFIAATIEHGYAESGLGNLDTARHAVEQTYKELFAAVQVWNMLASCRVGD